MNLATLLTHTFAPESGIADYETQLTTDEQRSIAFRLGPLLAGVGLLGLGALYRSLFPDQDAIASAMQAAAALLVAIPILKEGVEGFLSRPPKHMTEQLVSVAILAAMATGDFVTATLVPLFLELGHLFEERSSRGARAAIDGIRKLSAQSATKLVEGEEQEITPQEIEVGDQVLVRPGEIVPVDGTVVSGRSSIDQAPITGESLYEDVEPGKSVYSGTVNLDGLLRVEATGVGGQTVLGRVLKLLREVEASKTPVLRLLERYAGVYLPIVLAVAGVTVFMTGELDRAIAVLIVSCPCALVLAGPAAMVAAMTASTRLSMLIKSAGFLETVAEIDTLLLDKTGTVTTGALSLNEVTTVDGGPSKESVLRGAAICGYSSLHPISRAAVEAAERLGIRIEQVEHAREVPGEGVEARTDHGIYRLGRQSWLERQGLDFSGHVGISGPGAWVAKDDQVLGFLSLVDRPREEAQEALAATRRLGIHRTVMLTGDREVVARRVAEELGFDEVIAEVLPEQKLDIVRAEQEHGHKVMMVGDGVNDALALSGADVGVAVGARISEVALGGADVALMTPDLGRIPMMLRLAEYTRWIVILNAILGTGFSILMMALASTGVIDPLLGALMHNLGSLFVILNSSRILRFAQPQEERGPYIGPLPTELVAEPSKVPV
ncbi:MAG: cadmium-translocating P-type ATPase [Thermoanaerobaculia bacterium]|nr:cadmium-translocating P-type ATPase [Thermoanaerobaculia bacterium]